MLGRFRCVLIDMLGKESHSLKYFNMESCSLENKDLEGSGLDFMEKTIIGLKQVGIMEIKIIKHH